MAELQSQSSWDLRERNVKKMFGGVVKMCTHKSLVLDGKGLDMDFSIFLPPQAATAPVPSVLWLSGLTCTDENFLTKAGAQRVAAQLGIALIMPSTSPPKMGYDGETDKWDFGFRASMYLDATEEPWKAGYQMYSYIIKELIPMCQEQFAISKDMSICGHSMGGHGALMFHLRNPGMFKSCSAFSPICNPTKCPWGIKAFTNYLGSVEAGEAYDASLLVAKYAKDAKGDKKMILIDQGASDGFLGAEEGGTNQLMPAAFKSACESAGVPLKLRMQAGYDHSYYFIASFIEDHLRFHALHLQ